MERRYLVATLALVATFAIFSREFRAGYMAKLPRTGAELRADLACAKHYVADQLVAKVRPFVDRGIPEEQQMVAELNLPVLVRANEKVAESQALIAEQVAERNCEAVQREQERAMRAQETAQRAQERNLRAAERAQERASEMSARVQERAAEMSARAQERAQEFSARASERSVEVSARAMERAQKAMEKSHKWKFVFPSTPNPPSTAIPINFEFTMPSDIDQQVRAAVQSSVAGQCVRTKVAARQIQTVMVQRVNQNMRNNMNVVVSTQDVSGLSSLTQSPAAHAAIHKLGHELQHLQDYVARSIDNAFATL
jgi:hypothetical protein